MKPVSLNIAWTGNNGRIQAYDVVSSTKMQTSARLTLPEGMLLTVTGGAVSRAVHLDAWQQASIECP